MSAPALTPSIPAWARALRALADRALPTVTRGGVALNVAIDAHKALTGPLVLAGMALLDVFTIQAWVYLALHGSYGVAWVLKDVTFPDRQWRRRTSWGGALAAWAFLTLYWLAPAILLLGTAGVLAPGDGWAPASPPVLAGAIALYAVGLVLMVGADVQTNLTPALRDRPGLIADGFFARTRHPNYLGEMMIYGSFALVVGHWLPWVALAAAWGLVFVPNMLAIDASLARHPGYAAWRARTGFLLPRPGRRKG